MSAFENFIQIELPLRPYVTIDPPLETIPVRRGTGPRQLSFVDLVDNQVLGKINGVVTGVAISDIGQKGVVLVVNTAADTWYIPHNRNSFNCVVQIYEEDGAGWSIVYPDKVQLIDANNVVIKFGSVQAGRAHISFFNI